MEHTVFGNSRLRIRSLGRGSEEIPESLRLAGLPEEGSSSSRLPVQTPGIYPRPEIEEEGILQTPATLDGRQPGQSSLFTPSRRRKGRSRRGKRKGIQHARACVTDERGGSINPSNENFAPQQGHHYPPCYDYIPVMNDTMNDVRDVNDTPPVDSINLDCYNDVSSVTQQPDRLTIDTATHNECALNNAHLAALTSPISNLGVNNISMYTPSVDELRVLALGLNFIPEPADITNVEIYQALDEFTDTLLWKEQLDYIGSNTHNDTSDSPIATLRRKLRKKLYNKRSKLSTKEEYKRKEKGNIKSHETNEYIHAVRQ